MRSTTVLAVLLASVLGLVSCSRDPEVAKRRYLESGNKYYDRGKYKEARIFYKDAIQKDARFGPAYYKLGLTVLKLLENKQGSISEAVQSLRRAEELLDASTPEHWDASIKLSEIYLVAGSQKNSILQKEFVDEIERTIAGLLKRDPNSWDGHRLSGDLSFSRALQFLSSGQQEQALKTLNVAIEEYQKAETIKPNQVGVMMQLARARSGKGEAAEAEQLYRRVMSVDPKLRAVYNELYRLLVMQRKFPEGEAVLKAGFQADPKNFNMLIALAAHYSALKQRDSMAAVLQQIKSHFAEYPEAYQKVGDFYLQMGDADTAIREYNEGMSKDPAKKLVYQKRVIEVLMRQGKRDDAAVMNAAILKQFPNDNDAKGLAATFLLDKGDVAAALAELQALVSRAPDNAVARYNLGRAYFARRDYELARQSFKKAIDMWPDYIGARIGLAQLEIMRGEFEAALKDAGEIVARDPGNLSARLIESAALMGQRKFGESRKLLEAMIKANPGSPDTFYQLGVVNLAESKFKEADEAFRKSYQLNPANTRGLLGLVESQMAQNKPDAALKILQDEAAKNPGRTDLLLNMATIAVRAQRYDQAIAWFEQSLNAMDKSSRARGDVYLRLGETQRRKGDYSAAIASLQKSKEIQPDNTVTLITLGLVLDSNMGRWAEAKPIYESILKMEPKNGIALNNLAFLLAEHDGDLDEALTKATQAKQLLPNLAEVSDTLGWIYLKKGLPDSALPLFRDLVQKVPTNPTFRFHLGMALHMKGDKPKAIKELQDALKSNPGKLERDKIQEMLNRISAS